MTETTADHNGEPSTKQADPAPAKPKPSYRYRGGNDPPTALAHLRNAKRWVAWDYRLKSDKWTKPPFDPRTGRNASVSDPSTWTTFDEALAGMAARGARGLLASHWLRSALLQMAAHSPYRAIAP